MGLGEWLSEVGSGVKNIFTAPLGLVYDTARAITSQEYNPGFFGTFGKATEQLVGGLGQVGDAVGANWLGTQVGESRAGAPLRAFFREAELLYSTEFQRQEQDPGLVGGMFGAQPGTASFQRVAGTATGAAGSLIGAASQGIQGDLGQAGESLAGTVNLYRQWERAGSRTPGQAFVEEAVVPDFYSRTPEEQDEIRETAWYNLTTGTIDAVGRWFTDPGVIAGKSYKWTRNRYMTFKLDDASPSGISRSDNHYDSVRQLGYELGDELEPMGGARQVELKPGEHEVIYAVTRESAMNKMRGEGSLYREVDTDVTVRKTSDVAELQDLDNAFDVEADFARGENFATLDPEGSLKAESGNVDAQAFLDDVRENGIKEPIEIRVNEATGTGQVVDGHHRLWAAQQLGLEEVPVKIHRTKGEVMEGDILPDGFLGNSDNPRYAGTNYRPVALHSAADIDEVNRYAAALHAADPTDRPVIIEIDADGLPVIYEDFDVPYFPGKGDVDPRVASLFTLSQNLGPRIRRVHTPKGSEIDPAQMLDGEWPSYMEPPDTMNPRMFDPEGRPIEPDQAIDFEGFTGDLHTLLDLNPVDAEKYLIARQRQRNGAQSLSDDMVQNASQNRTFQSYLNWMHGKSSDDIRRVLFPNNPYGGIIAVWLADAKGYSERRSILLATMGHKDPNIDVLQPLLKAKLEKVLRAQAEVRAGRPPDELFQGMMGASSRFKDMSPESMVAGFDELAGEIADQVKLNAFLDRVSDMAPVSQLRMPVLRRGTNMARKTTFYQQSPMARPLRSVTEWRPHRFVNVNDPYTDVQIVRQLEEARPLGIGAEEVANFRHKYNAAQTPEQKIAIVEEVNQRIVKKAAERAGLSPEEFEELLRVSHRGRVQAQTVLESRRYAPGGRDIVRHLDPDTGELVEQILPLLSTQTQGWLVMPDVMEINRVSSRLGAFKKRHGFIPREMLSSFYQVWKPTVLLRGGWMLRVVSDEQLRILATTGSLIKHLAAISKGDNVSFLGGVFRKNQKDGRQITGGQRAAGVFAVATGTRPATAMATRAAKATTVVGDRMGLLDPEYMKFIEDAGLEDLVSARSSFGGPSEATLHSLQALMGRDEFTILDHLYDGGTGQWMSIDRGDPMFGSAWQRVLKDQFGRDELGRVVAESVETFRDHTGLLGDEGLDKVYEATLRWLRDTPEGLAYQERLPWRRNLEKWADDVIETFYDYTAGFDENLVRGTIHQKITTDMLNAIDERLRPDTVHGEVIAQTFGKGPVMEFIRDFTSEAYDLLGRLPTDTLSRQPFFRQIYAREMQRLHAAKVLQGLDIDETALRRMDQSSRQLAIRETRALLYDLAETSRFGDIAKFIMPFYPAWQEVFKVWGKIAIEDPSIIARGRIIWQAPNKANLIYTDDEGEEYLQFRLSEQTSDKLGLTGWQKYLAEGGMRFGKSSFNLILNNPLPGVGPLIQYPINEVVKKKPELEESLRFLLPFGVATDSTQILLSPLVRQLKSEIQGASGDRSYERAFADALTWMDVEYRAGRRSTPPTEAEAHDVAAGLHTVRLVTRLMSPSQPIFDSPLQPYIDIYRDMQDNLGPDTASEAFLNEYGNEFFAVTISRTVSKTGIPPTVEAEMARRQFEELIEQYPEYGRLIIGDAALGEFSTAAFASQLERPIDPDNPFSEMERTYRPTELDPRTGTIIEVDRRLGWQEYIQAMDLIDLKRKELGLPSLRVAGAAQLAEAKNMVTEALAQKYPAWWEDFNTRDGLAWTKRVEAFNAITNDPVAFSRPDIQGLSQYLEARQAVLQELNRRKMLGGSSTLESVANQDLANLWETVVTQILDENIAFGPLYYRYLEGDPVSLR